MRTSVFDAVYTCQLLNVSLAVVAGAVLARLVRRVAPPGCDKAASIFAFALFLATPWVLITASMAYDEAMALALGAAVLSLSLSPAAEQDESADTVQKHWKTAALTGLLLGLATLAKLTSGLMLAIPIGLIWLLRMTTTTRQAPWK
jgi:4-amino-4-deoxy-L-arabinose transferase-like glycosyltransferase